MLFSLCFYSLGNRAYLSVTNETKPDFTMFPQLKLISNLKAFSSLRATKILFKMLCYYSLGNRANLSVTNETKPDFTMFSQLKLISNPFGIPVNFRYVSS